jgi:hypothetical protein
MTVTLPTPGKDVLEGLLERVKAASGPDRAIDGELDAALRIGLASLPEWAWANFPKWKHISNGRVCVLHDSEVHGLNWASARVTASVDAALALVERLIPEHSVLMGYGQTKGTLPWARIGIWSAPDATAPILPLAILSALLSALIAQVQP